MGDRRNPAIAGLAALVVVLGALLLLQARQPYRLRSAPPAASQKLRLLARAGAGVTRLHWYQDGRFLGARPPAEPLFVPLARGAHRVVVVDDAGRMDSVGYAVE